MVGWHHQINGHELEQELEVGDAIQPSHPLLPPSPLALADLSLFLHYLLKLSFYRSIYGGPDKQRWAIFQLHGEWAR